ncbi:transposase [Streptomyces sp. NPDC002758]
MDNYGTHKTPAIKAWLAKHPRFELHFTATGSSWINQVERWFGYLAHQMIRRGAHKNIQALEADIRAWVKDWNEDPKPFIWTKTAEEILDSLARFCRRISGAGQQQTAGRSRRQPPVRRSSDTPRKNLPPSATGTAQASGAVPAPPRPDRVPRWATGWSRRFLLLEPAPQLPIRHTDHCGHG